MSDTELSPKNASRLQWAQFFAETGNLAPADILCRMVLDVAGESATAYKILGMVAEQIGERDRAVEYHQTAARLGERNAEGNLTRLQAENSRPPDVAGAPRFLLIKSWGQGFWSDVAHVAGSLLLAELTGRTPLVWWGNASRFGDGSGGNAFDKFFSPIGNVPIDEVCRTTGATFFPPIWNRENVNRAERNAAMAPHHTRYGAIYFLNRPETVAVADCYIAIPELAPWIPRGHQLAGLSVEDLWRHVLDKYLHPVPAVTARVAQFVAEKFGAAAFTAAHVRGSDKLTEHPTLARDTDEAFARLAALDFKLPIFFMTDDQRIARRAIEQFGSRVVMTDCQRTESAFGVHIEKGVDRVRAGHEVMIDVYTALRADSFLGFGWSNPSAFVSVLKRWPAGRCTLLGRSNLFGTGAYVYLPPKLVHLVADIGNP